MSEKSGWVGGPLFHYKSKFGSKGSNSSTPGRSGGSYSCGVPRGRLGEIMKNLQASWRAKSGRRASTSGGAR